jgi:hypothetical protein
MTDTQTTPVDPFDDEFGHWASRQAPGASILPRPGGGRVIGADSSAAPAARQLESFHAYQNNRPEVDWNTCGQAAIASITDFHGQNPYNLPRVGAYWDDGAAIDAIINGGYGPDVVFGWGTTGGRITDALRSYGLHADVGYSGLSSAGWQDQWNTLRSYVEQRLPVPVLLDLGSFPGGPWWTAHWAVAYRIEEGQVYLGNCGWAPVTDERTFLSAWHAWFLPYGFNHCAVYAY